MNELNGSDVVAAVLDSNEVEANNSIVDKTADGSVGKELKSSVGYGSPTSFSSQMASYNFSFLSTPPRKGLFVDLIDYLLRHGTLSPDCQTVEQSPDFGASLSTNGGLQKCFTMEIVDHLCDEARAVLETERALLDIHVKEDETLVVVGDIHGDFSDLLFQILSEQFDKEINVDGSDRKFLFLGDFVDRGPCGVEVVMLLYALKVEYPQLIHIIRGNHEEPQTSRIYGFFNEVNTKFGSDSAWIRFNEVFCYIPLAAVVTTPTTRFFAAHGGLSPPLSESFDIIQTIERSDYGSVLDNVLSEVVDGLLWSDPTDAISHFERNSRGCGYMFGPKASEEFCQMNQFDFICRAHQVVKDGYAWNHEKRVLTIFSVPNYCGFNDNLGAVMIVCPSDTAKGKEEIRFKQFTPSVANNTASSPPPEPTGEFVFAAFTE